MEPTLTPEQKKQLVSWVSQRDLILFDITNKKTEQEKLIAENKNLASSNTEIANKIQQSIGRLEELTKKEDERVKLISVECSSAITVKSVLQSEISSLKAEVEVLSESKQNLHDDIASITKIHEAVFARASEIERIISETVKLNSTNAFEIKNILIEAATELKKVIDIGAENVAVTNRTIAEIPKIIVDIHRDVIERRKAARAKLP